jgi:hypothetical protein
MNTDIPESLEDRIAPASLIDAVPAGENSAAGSVMLPAEQPFFGPLSAEASDNGSASAPMDRTSIEDGRPIMDVPASSISPAFIDAVPGASLGDLDATLAFRGLLESDSARDGGIHDILADGVEPNPDTLGLAQSAALSEITTIAGLAAPVLLVDVPKIDRAL